MEKVDAWPPPEGWTEVVVTWTRLLEAQTTTPTMVNQLLEWIDSAPGGRYHLHGYQSTEGFAFRFEHPEDAIYFKLRWS